MAYLVGIILALTVSSSATLVGLDRDRAFYPTVLAVIASYYDLFAIMGNSGHALIVESAVTTLFLCAVILGFRRNLWVVVAALAGHGIFDFVHADVIANPGVPVWWPMFCLAYDIAAAAYLSQLLWRSKIKSVPIKSQNMPT